MINLPPQEGLAQMYSKLDLELEDLLSLMEMIHEFSEAVETWGGDKKMGWGALLMVANMALSLKDGYNVDISYLAEVTGYSRHSIRRIFTLLRIKNPDGPMLIQDGRHTTLNYEPADYPAGYFWKNVVEIFKRNLNLEHRKANRISNIVDNNIACSGPYLTKMTPQEGLAQIFSKIDVEVEDILHFLQLILDLSDAVESWMGDKRTGWAMLLIECEIGRSLRDGHEVDISSLSVATGDSRDKIRRYLSNLRQKYPTGPKFTFQDRHMTTNYNPIDYPAGYFWEKITEIYRKNLEAQ